MINSMADYFIILLYVCFIFFLAFKANKSLKESKKESYVYDQFLASKSLSFWESISSIIATEVSALTFLGIPAFAFSKDFSFLQIYVGAILGRIIIAQVFLPKIYDKGLTIYSVMGAAQERGNGRQTVAFFYSLNKLLAVGVRLFSGSILVAEFFDTNIYIAVAMICILTFFYTLVGGLKAVVRTDMAQMILFICGGLLAHYIIPVQANIPWSELMSSALNAGKLSLVHHHDWWGLFYGITGGIIFDLSTHGVDQDFIQRLTGNRTIEGAKKAIQYSSVLSILVAILFLSIGSLLWAYYQTQISPDISPDKLFAYFISENFPIGTKGLMVAGVLAATMSTLDSTINALSATLYNDIFHHRDIDPHAIKKHYRRDTFAITLILMLVAFVASHSSQMLILGLKITSWTSGSLLALFLATVIFTRLNYKMTFLNVIGTYLIGASMVYLNTYHIKLPWEWNVVFGVSGSLIYITIHAKLIQKLA